jgi:hypothetical protein
MNIFKPTVAKIVSTPSITIAFLLFYMRLITTLPPIILLLVILVSGYLISCIAWANGKNHRRSLIVIFTLLTSLSAFFILDIFAGLSSFCLNSCGGDFGPCPTPCPETQTSIFLTYLSIGIPILSILIGIISFIKERKVIRGKLKKRA